MNNRNANFPGQLEVGSIVIQETLLCGFILREMRSLMKALNQMKMSKLREIGGDTIGLLLVSISHYLIKEEVLMSLNKI